MWFSKSNFKPEGKVAVVLGASQGLGANLALKLYQRNCSVILVARTERKLQEQVERISRAGTKGVVVSYECCDASDYDECARVWKKITEEQKVDPDFIFCCAGSSIPKLFGDLTKEELSLGMSTNYSTALNFVHTGFKQVLSMNPGKKYHEHKKRHLILFSSVVGFFPFIGYSQYAPMKSAVESLSIILRQELGPYNYRVTCVFPGSFMSEGFEEEEKTKPRITKEIEGPSKPISGEKCADIIFDQLSKGRNTITTDFIGWFLSCSVLGMLPRTWGLIQVLISFVILIIAPIVKWSIYRDVLNYFEARSLTKRD